MSTETKVKDPTPKSLKPIPARRKIQEDPIWGTPQRPRRIAKQGPLQMIAAFQRLGILLVNGLSASGRPAESFRRSPSRTPHRGNGPVRLPTGLTIRAHRTTTTLQPRLGDPWPPAATPCHDACSEGPTPRRRTRRGSPDTPVLSPVVSKAGAMAPAAACRRTPGPADELRAFSDVEIACKPPMSTTSSFVS